MSAIEEKCIKRNQMEKCIKWKREQKNISIILFFKFELPLVKFDLISSFRAIIIMSATKYLNKLQHFEKYLEKSFSMQNSSKSFPTSHEPCFSVNYNFIIVIPKQKWYLLLTFFSQVIVLMFFKKRYHLQHS